MHGDDVGRYEVVCGLWEWVWDDVWRMGVVWNDAGIFCIEVYELQEPVNQLVVVRPVMSWLVYSVNDGVNEAVGPPILLHGWLARDGCCLLLGVSLLCLVGMVV